MKGFHENDTDEETRWGKYRDKFGEICKQYAVPKTVPDDAEALNNTAAMSQAAGFLLICGYLPGLSNSPSALYYYLLGPLKVEELSIYPTQILMIHNLVFDSEIEDIKAHAKPQVSSNSPRVVYRNDKFYRRFIANTSFSSISQSATVQKNVIDIGTI